MLSAAHELRTPLTSVRGSVNCTPRQLFPASILFPGERRNAGPRRWEPAREGDAVGAAAEAAVVGFAVYHQPRLISAWRSVEFRSYRAGRTSIRRWSRHRSRPHTRKGSRFRPCRSHFLHLSALTRSRVPSLHSRATLRIRSITPRLVLPSAFRKPGSGSAGPGAADTLRRPRARVRLATG